MGTVNVSLSDPPSCTPPNGDFQSVFVSIRSVQAHISSTANDNSSGWQELAPQLNTTPVQLDLLHLPQSGQCLLAQLGSNTSLPAGDYQQIRLLLVSNNPGGNPTPSPNACAGHGFNCVVLADNSVHDLDLSSQANTGLKIPPGQIVGGPIHVGAGQSVDINIDFNACDSIVPEDSTGRFRLKPTLTAGQVSTNTSGISGNVIDLATGNSLVGGTVLVALELPDGGGTDRVFRQIETDANGNFTFCPLPPSSMFDVVVVGINGAGVAFNATAIANVPGGTSLTNIPLVAETGIPTGPGVIQGFVTALNGATGASIDAAMSALASVSFPSGPTRTVTIPLENTLSQTSTPNLAVDSNISCPGGAPANAFCAQYTLIVPASFPFAGTFSGGSVTFAVLLPATGNVPYTVEADAFAPLGGGATICTPATMTTSLDESSATLVVNPGATTNAQRLDFSGCVVGP